MVVGEYSELVISIHYTRIRRQEHVNNHIIITDQAYLVSSKYYAKPNPRQWFDKFVGELMKQVKKRNLLITQLYRQFRFRSSRIEEIQGHTGRCLCN